MGVGVLNPSQKASKRGVESGNVLLHSSKVRMGRISSVAFPMETEMRFSSRNFWIAAASEQELVKGVRSTMKGVPGAPGVVEESFLFLGVEAPASSASRFRFFVFSTEAGEEEGAAVVAFGVFSFFSFFC